MPAGRSSREGAPAGRSSREASRDSQPGDMSSREVLADSREVSRKVQPGLSSREVSRFVRSRRPNREGVLGGSAGPVHFMKGFMKLMKFFVKFVKIS